MFALKLPHVPVTADSPVVSQYDPASQVVQDGAAVVAAYDPVGQEMHAVCCTPSWYFPAAQKEQIDAPATA